MSNSVTEESLRDYQVADLAFLIANKKALYLHDPAVGKTPTVCVLMQYCWQEEKIGTAWVMPKSLLEKNYFELLRFTDFTRGDICILDQDNKNYASGVTVLHPKDLAQSTYKVYLMGFRRFTTTWKQLPDYIKFLCGDEIHLKGWAGAKTANVAALWEAMKNHFVRYVPMTGTLVSGRLDTAYPSIHVIEPRYYPSHEAFMNYHGNWDFDGNLIGWQNGEKLREIFSRHGIRRTFESVYGKEQKIILPELCYMGKEHRKIFDRFKEQAYLELDKFIIDGTLPGVGFIRGRQIQEHPNWFPDLTSSGKFVDALKGTVPAKIERLEVMFGDDVRTGKPHIIFSALVPQQKQIFALAKSMGLAVALINGEVPAGLRAQIDREYREGKLTHLIGTPQVAAVGFNWQECGDQELGQMTFPALDYLDTSLIQAIRRAIRGVRKSPLLVRVMEYADSMDQRVFDIIRRKSKEAHEVDPTREVFDLSAKGGDPN